MEKSLILKSLGMRIRKRRKMLGLSQERLGELAGVSYQQIQKYEKGINQVGIERLHRIASILQVTPDYFLTGTQITKEDTPIYGGLTSMEKKLLRYFREIEDQKIQSQVIALVRLTANLIKK